MNIDVVIPTYNRLWALKRVLPFYLKCQMVRQIIVVNDCSTDGAREWLEEQSQVNPRIISIHHGTNKGASAARNTGALKTSAPYVFFADDDMLLDPENGLEILVNDLIRSSGDIIAPIFIYSENEVPEPANLSSTSTRPSRDFLFNSWTLELKPRRIIAENCPASSFESGLTCGIMLMKREVLEHVRYDETLGLTSYRDETDFQLTALQKGLRLFACPSVNLIDLKMPGDKGGCHSTGLVAYEWRACRNNWKILNRHRKTIRNCLEIKVAVELIQALFLYEHLIKRLPRFLSGKILRMFKLIK